MRHITVDICTKDRYSTTLPLTLQSVICQTRTPDALIIVDDSKKPVDLRTIPTLKYLLQLLDEKRIAWKVLYGKKMGQQFSHQIIQEEAKDLVWRIDDDVVAEPECLEKLVYYFEDETALQVIGAVGGPILMPGADTKEVDSMTLNLNDNQQWHRFEEPKEATHLYSSFLYKSGIVDYELSLSSAAHREETILTHNIHRKGYKLVLEPAAICWHLRNPEGGIRNNKPEDWGHDQKIYEEIQREWGGELIAYLDSGLGDHVIFKSILPSLRLKYKSIKIACCYPELFKGEEVMSIADGMKLITPERLNVYKWCIDHDWKTELKEAMVRMYDNNSPL